MGGYGAWLYIPEITPLRVRGKAVGLCTFANWGPANIISAFITPVMTNWSPGGTLLFFATISVVTVPMCVLLMPETRGLSLEEVGSRFRFNGASEFRQFMQGNLKYGTGILGRPAQQTQKSGF